MNRLLRPVFIALVILVTSFCGFTARASHLYGGDLGYTYVSGNTYKVTLTLYANCAGTAYPALLGSVAQVTVYNGTTTFTTLTLPQEGAPVEVTPVCPAQANQTACFITNSPTPGVKRFIFSVNVTLSGLSANWRFRFNGNAGGNTGRSGNIGNIVGGSTMSLEATLNNTLGPNSSPVYTTIPTPFFCVNKTASYNPGTIDADGDLLTFGLVPGIIPTTGVVVYNPPFTATAPLSSTTGTFSFSNATGQLDFTPNNTQISLVVSQVSEYRGSTLVGTSMREMTFVVVPCLNNPPGGVISSPSSGVNQLSGTAVTVCKEVGLFTFNINPTDADSDPINVSALGLPAGATLNITNNNTTAPTSILAWNVSNVTPGTYSFFVTYTDNGCPLASKQTLAYTITVLPNPGLTFNLISPATCTNKAVFTVTPSGATGPYIINFGTTSRTGSTSTITDSLTPGTYTFSVTAANGCAHDTSIVIASPASTQISALTKQNTCNGTANGAVTLSATNSVPPYTFAVGPGAFSAGNSFPNLATGSYAFHVKDQQGCIKDTVITINDSLTVAATIVVTNASCNATATGAMQVSGGGAISPYQYALGTNTFGPSGNFTGLAAGTYSVHVKDNLGCFKDMTAAITQPTALAIGATVTDLLCNGASTGVVTISASGGVSPYTFAQGTGAYTSNPIFASIPAGSYTFHIKDANGCIKDTTPITLQQPTPIQFAFTVTNVFCNGGNSGAVLINASGGTPSYIYGYDANSFTSSNNLNFIVAGTHIIHVRDINGCQKDSTITLTQPAPILLSLSYTDPTCSGANNGTITIAGTGGATPYTYALNSNPYTANGNRTGLTPGNYIIHLKDANNCPHDTFATLVEPTPVAVATMAKRPRCTPITNGMVTLFPAGGTPGYTFAVGTNAYGTSPVFNNLGSGNYTFHVKDTRGCIKDVAVNLVDSVAVHATTLISPPKCFGSADGAIDITPSGGDAPYVYAVNAGTYTASSPIANLLSGNYVLHVKDANGCILDTNQTVSQPSLLVPGAVVTQPLCYQGTDGRILASATGGTAGYLYAVGSGVYGASANLTGLAAGTHLVHLKDANGCIRDTTVTMGQPTQLTYTSLVLSHNFCSGDSSGMVTVRAAGGTVPYTYATDAKPYSSNNILTPLKAGVRVIHLKDGNGCVHDTTIRLTEPAKIYVLIDSLIHPTCEGYKDGVIRIAGAAGGQPAYTYSPDNISFSTQLIYGGLPEGSFKIFAKDVFGCQADTTVALKGYPHILIDGATVSDARCAGSADGVFDLLVSGGNPSFRYYMKTPADSNQTGRFDSLRKGLYGVHIVDAKGCFKDTTVAISQPDTLRAAVSAMPNDCEGYDNSGSVTVTATGGTAPYYYAWSTAPGQAGSQITGLANGPYKVIVSDARSCMDSALAVVGYDNCCKPYVVNAFTPNGDGHNDRFRVVFKGDMKLENFSIYNRFGQRVFYTTSSDAAWDGNWNDKPQDLGTYFYFIRLICGHKGDQVLEYKGDVTLIR